MTAESDYFVLGVFCPCLSDTGIRGSNRNMFSHTHVYIWAPFLYLCCLVLVQDLGRPTPCRRSPTYRPLLG